MPLRNKQVANSSSRSCDGTQVRFDELVDLHVQSARLLPGGSGNVWSLFPGNYRSQFRGRGLEFDEVRSYQTGDDLRSLDWRVTARTGEFHTKLFHEERERSLYILIDAGPHMQFGTRTAFKWVVAARIAALFSWLAHDQGERIGGLVFGDSRHCHPIRAGAGQNALRRWFRLLAGIHPVPLPGKPEHSRLCDALASARRLALPGSGILLLSDFSDPGPDLGRQLAGLSRHHDILGIRLYDPLEAQLPAGGVLAFSDGEASVLVDTSNPVGSARYRQQFERDNQALVSLFQGVGQWLTPFNTAQPLVEGLQPLLPPRNINFQRNRHG